jgi:phosphonate transport system substrate-binding protein
MSRETVKQLNFQPLYSGSSANVFKAVDIGKATAGATLDSDFGFLPPAEAGRFRTILKTPPISSHPLSAHPRVPDAAREAVAAAVLALGAAPADQALLAAVRLAEPVRADYARDYRSLEEVDLRKLSAGQ